MQIGKLIFGVPRIYSLQSKTLWAVHEIISNAQLCIKLNFYVLLKTENLQTMTRRKFTFNFLQKSIPELITFFVRLVILLAIDTRKNDEQKRLVWVKPDEALFCQREA